MINSTLETGVVDPNRPDAGSNFEPLAISQHYHNIIYRRVAAYLIDVVIVGGVTSLAFVTISISGLLTFGLGFTLIGPVLFIIPLAYHTFLIGGPCSATWGMRLMGIEVRRWRAGRPDLLQAAILTILFYGSVTMTGWVILVVGLFSNSRRCLHDYFSGTVVINKSTENGTIRPGASPKWLPFKDEERTIDRN